MSVNSIDQRSERLRRPPKPKHRKYLTKRREYLAKNHFCLNQCEKAADLFATRLASMTSMNSAGPDRTRAK